LLKIGRGCTLSIRTKQKGGTPPVKSPAATPEKRVRETEVNVQEEIWKFIAATLKQGLRHLLEGLLEDEVTTKVNARKYERSSRRQGYRGGHYLRDLVTRYGLLEDLRVPRMAEGPLISRSLISMSGAVPTWTPPSAGSSSRE